MKAKPQYSVSSRKAEDKQSDLKGREARAETELARLRGNLEQAKSDERRYAEIQASGQFLHPANLETVSMVIVSLERQIKAVEGTIAGIKAEIVALQPSAAQAAEQQAKLTATAKQGRALVWKVAEVDRIISDARKALKECLGITHSMRKNLEACDFDLAGDRLNEEQFKSLLASLPTDLESVSKQWLADFLGEPEPGMKPCRVTAEVLFRRENLTHNGVCHAGDVIYLTREEAEDLMQGPGYGKVEPIGWKPAAKAAVNESVAASSPERPKPERAPTAPTAQELYDRREGPGMRRATPAAFPARHGLRTMV